MKKLLFILWFFIFGIVFSQSQNDEPVAVLETDSVEIQKGKLIKKLGHVLKPIALQWQYAGNIGMHSVGAEWNVIKRKIRLGLALGYVPDSRSI